MNLNGIGNPLGGARAPLAEPRPRVERERLNPNPAAPAGVAAPAAPQRTGAPAAAPRTTVPAEAPAGTDPELWAVLTSDERNFFAKVGAMGPLTYGHLMTAQSTDTPIVRGGRLDVRA